MRYYKNLLVRLKWLLIGNFGDQIRQTNIRFRNMDDFGSYINAIDEGYDVEDAIFNGHFI